MRKITIEGVNNGWVITVGCSTFVAVDKEKMLKEIGRYIDNPGDVEKEYLGNPVNSLSAPAPGAEDCLQQETAPAGQLVVAGGSGGSLRR